MHGYQTKIQPNGKLKRGPVVSIPKREYSEPIPDDVLSRFEDAALVLDDNDHTYTAYVAGTPAGTVWGPSVEDEWFVRPAGQNARRVLTRDVALIVLADQASGDTRPSFAGGGAADA